MLKSQANWCAVNSANNQIFCIYPLFRQKILLLRLILFLFVTFGYFIVIKSSGWSITIWGLKFLRRIFLKKTTRNSQFR